MEADQTRSSVRVPTWGAFLLLVYLLLLNLGFLAALAISWPGARDLIPVLPDLPSEVRVFLVSLAGGGLGATVTLLMSLITYLGNRALVQSWVWWYVARPFVGLSLGFLVYAAVRGGILKLSADADVLNVYFVAILAALAGAFSKEILDRFSSENRTREVMDTLLRKD